MNFKKLTWVLLIASSSVSAVAMSQGDSRSMGMGGTGAASASYLASSLHNPARAVRYGDNDNFGLLLPTIGVSGKNLQTLSDKVENFNGIDEELENDRENSELQEEWRAALSDLDNETANAQVNVGLVMAIPNKYLSTNFLVTAQANAMALVNVDQRDLDNLDAEYTNGEIAAGGHIDVGFTFAKSYEVGQRALSVGVSPKLQHLFSVSETEDLEDYGDDEDFNSTEKSVFNIDLGFNYEISNNLEVAFVAKNLLSQELVSHEDSLSVSTYQVEPEYVAAIAYNTRLYSVAMDVDLNSRQYFKEYENEFQFASVGAEFNAWDWAQIRVGYKHSMTDYAQSLITGGLGFTPFGKFGLDIAAQYGEDENLGVSAQIIVTL